MGEVVVVEGLIVVEGTVEGVSLHLYQPILSEALSVKLPILHHKYAVEMGITPILGFSEMVRSHVPRTPHIHSNLRVPTQSGSPSEIVMEIFPPVR